ncbi:PP2C family protein-serine/threonine phosphatase [Yoonia sp. 208BN28-4]|uniref:PP2C family protein-serine/threonine phosphatase n=1 Tax=Yoonia sp. 208BN28-4 TaxID=3126505 RepID=UPI0030992080
MNTTLTIPEFTPIPPKSMPWDCDDAPVPVAPRAASSSDTEISPARARIKIVVAEDSELQRLYLCCLINELGFEAIEAEDGKIALDLLKATGAQILITDLSMPHLNGIEVTQSVRQLGGEVYVHIIMLTSADEAESRDAALIAGVDDFITKGSSTAMLKARLRTATRFIDHATELAERTRVLAETHKRIQDDLTVAAAAQRQLLPTLNQDILGFSVASAFVPSAILSGDMFGCFALGGGHLGFYMVDVSGHGIQASLLSVAIGHLVTKEFFQNVAFDEAGAPDPATLVSALNDRFSACETDDYFTMFCGIIDTQTGRLDFCQAGSPSPFYVTDTGAVHDIGDGGFPVGLIAHATYENNSHIIAQGGALIVCSDAASEAENTAHVPFGYGRVRAVAQSAAATNPTDVPHELVAALSAWRGGRSLDDDLTVVTLKRK